MPSLCILTDSTIQFIKPVFPSRTMVKIIPLQPQSGVAQSNPGSKAGSPLFYGYKPLIPDLLYPGVEEFRQQFISLGREYNEIIVLLKSSHLGPMSNYAKKQQQWFVGELPSG